MKFLHTLLLIVLLPFFSGCFLLDSDPPDFGDVDTSREDTLSKVSSLLDLNMPYAYNHLIETPPLCNISVLHDTMQYKQYTTHYKQALNLGVYAIDLLYCKLHDNSRCGQAFYPPIQNLMKELGMSENLNFYTVDTTLQHAHFKQLLALLITNLKENRNTAENPIAIQTELLIITGGLIEEMYIAAQNDLNNDDIQTILAGRKLIINDLLMQAEFYELTEDENFRHEILPGLNELKALLKDRVKIRYMNAPPELVLNENGEFEMKRRKMMHVQTDMETLLATKEKIELLRNAIIQPKVEGIP